MNQLINVNYSYLIVINRLLFGLFGSRSCGVARSIIAGFHPVDPGSNPGTSTMTNISRNKAFDLFKTKGKFEGGPKFGRFFVEIVGFHKQ